MKEAVLIDEKTSKDQFETLRFQKNNIFIKTLLKRAENFDFRYILPLSRCPVIPCPVMPEI